MIQRLPTRLQERWRDVADRIISIQQREAPLKTLLDLLSNPISPQVVLKIVPSQQVRNSKSPFVVSTTQSDDVPEMVARKPDRSTSNIECVFCSGDHKSIECTTLVPMNLRER